MTPHTHPTSPRALKQVVLAYTCGGTRPPVTAIRLVTEEALGSLVAEAARVAAVAESDDHAIQRAVQGVVRVRGRFVRAHTVASPVMLIHPSCTLPHTPCPSACIRHPPPTTCTTLTHTPCAGTHHTHRYSHAHPPPPAPCARH